ncbi:MAG: hypothetical protein IH868_07335 [Chloroflexi bacterium]|nr:hypothetical protein [Chloroflexota bacterium]
MNFRGVIIEESLGDLAVLEDVAILSTKVEPVTADHKTPWVDQWTLHTIELPEHRAEEIAGKLSTALDSKHSRSWYADFKNEDVHYVVFKDRVFKVDLREPVYRKAMEYGVSLGIPWYQLDFSPEIEEWKRE